MLNEDYKEMLQLLIEEKVNIPSLDDLICNKKATGRTKDIADVEVLEELREAGLEYGR